MEDFDFNSYTNEQLKKLASEMTPKQILDAIAHFSPEQISALMQGINDLHDSNWIEKSIAAVQGLSARPSLEDLGRSLSNRQACEIMAAFASGVLEERWKLSPIFVGMSQHTFSSMLLSADERILPILRLEGVAEPLQHHLTLLANELTISLEDVSSQVMLLEDTIAAIDPQEIQWNNLNILTKKFSTLTDYVHSLLNKAAKALAIAWNTNRPDLVEKISGIKETFQKIQLQVLGSPRSEDVSPQGIYLLLEQKLFSVYGINKGPKDIEALKDEDHAIEGIAKFSVWYLQDYWEIGLLPSAENPSEFQKHNDGTEQERSVRRARIFDMAKSNLEKIGLATVKDLKAARIFSKQTLCEYIDSHKSLLGFSTISGK